MTGEFWEWLLCAGLAGVLAGQAFTHWCIWGYLAAKRPDRVGFRTGIPIKGRMYYLCTSDEYLSLPINRLSDDPNPTNSAGTKPCPVCGARPALLTGCSCVT